MSDELDQLSSILDLRAEVKALGEAVDTCHAMAQKLEALGEAKAAAGWYVKASRAAEAGEGAGDPFLPVWFAEQAVRLAPADAAAQRQLAAACKREGSAVAGVRAEAKTLADAAAMERRLTADDPAGTVRGRLAALFAERGDGDKAVGWFLKAASHAERHLDLRAALAHVEKAAALSGSKAVQRELARLRWVVGGTERR